MTVEDAARLLGVSRSTMYKGVHRKEVPSIRIGRRILIPTRALKRLLEADSALEKDG